MQELSQHDVSSLPVLGKPGSTSELVGMISRQDVTRTYTKAAKGLLKEGKEGGRMAG